MNGSGRVASHSSCLGLIKQFFLAWKEIYVTLFKSCSCKDTSSRVLMWNESQSCESSRKQVRSSVLLRKQLPCFRPTACPGGVCGEGVGWLKRESFPLYVFMDFPSLCWCSWFTRVGFSERVQFQAWTRRSNTSLRVASFYIKLVSD